MNAVFPKARSMWPRVNAIWKLWTLNQSCGGRSGPVFCDSASVLNAAMKTTTNGSSVTTAAATRDRYFPVTAARAAGLM